MVARTLHLSRVSSTDSECLGTESSVEKRRRISSSSAPQLDCLNRLSCTSATTPIRLARHTHCCLLPPPRPSTHPWKQFQRPTHSQRDERETYFNSNTRSAPTRQPCILTPVRIIRVSIPFFYRRFSSFSIAPIRSSRSFYITHHFFIRPT